MVLKPYRRHRKKCEGGHSEDARTCQFEGGRRGWQKCRCLIHVSGPLGGKFSRKQTGLPGRTAKPDAGTLAGGSEGANPSAP